MLCCLVCAVSDCVFKCVGAWFNNACVLSVTYSVMFYVSIVCVMCYVGVCALFQCMCAFFVDYWVMLYVFGLLLACTCL